MRPGDREVVTLLEPLEVGDTFKNWPLHITIVPWFRVDVPSDKLAAELADELADVRPFQVSIGKEAFFGGRQKLVNLVVEPSPLADIEAHVRAVLKAHDAWLVDETTQRKRPYRPHVTAQVAGRVHEGDKITIHKLYIVSQHGDYKQIESEIALHG